MARLNVDNIEGLASDSTVNITSSGAKLSVPSLEVAQSTLGLPTGTINDRPSNPIDHSLRYSDSANGFELYDPTEANWSGTLTGNNLNLVDIGQGGGGGSADLTEDQYNDQQLASYSLPVDSGLVGWYDVSSYSETTGVWTDKSGNSNNTIGYRGAWPPSIQPITNKNGGQFGANRILKAVTGDRTQGLQFPTAILPGTFTLFHVTRYSGTYRGRIFEGVTANWLSGFHGGGAAKAYHDGWITQQGNTYYGRNWQLTMDQNSRARFNKGDYEATGGGGTSKQLSINYGNWTGAAGATGGTNEVSDWQCVEVIVYNRTLTSNEYQDVENYLDNKYQFTYF